MVRDFIIELPLVDQRKETKNKKWAHRTCAICSLKMVMAWKNKKLGKVPVMELVNKGLEMDGYINNIGWKHKALVDIAGRYGVEISFIEKFFRTKTQKTKGLGMINKKLAAGEPVLVSVFYKFKKKNGGHIVVLNGLRKDRNRVMGYFTQDPDAKFKGSNYFLSTKEFRAYWRGGLIYLL